MSKETKPQLGNNEEVDLSQLFKLIGNSFDRFFKFIGGIFNKLFLAFVWMVFFTKKHFIKIAIVGVLGFALGFLKEKISEPVYKSYCIVKQNYNSGEYLYNSVSDINDLVQQKDLNTLEKIIGNQSIEISSILGFEIEPVVTEQEKLRKYDNYLKTLDSVVASKVQYEDFLEDDKDYTNKYQQLTIKSKSRNNFNEIFKKIITTVETSDFYKREQEKDIKQLNRSKKAIEEALIKSDSLQNTYKKVLEISSDKLNGSEIGITLEGTNNIEKTKEFDLYINDIKLRRELVQIEREIDNKENIIEIISSSQNNGAIDNKIDVSGFAISPKLFYAFLFSFTAFLVLLGLRFIKFLEKYR